MANVFVNLPTTAADGAGAAVDVSSMGTLKTVTVSDTGNVFQPFVTVEFSCEAVPVTWTPLKTFQAAGAVSFLVACMWMRVTTSNYRGGSAPNVDVGSDDGGAVGASSLALPSPASSGLGAAIDVSALGNFKTVQIGGSFRGAVNILISQDGVDYEVIGSTTTPKAISQPVAAQWMRVQRVGVPDVNPGLPVVSVAATPFGSGISTVITDGVTITGNGTGGSPIAAIFSGFNENVEVAVDGTTITGTGLTASPLAVDPTALAGNVEVVTDGVTILGNGTTGNALEAAEFTAATPGVVPASGGGGSTFIRDDGVWASPAATQTSGGWFGFAYDGDADLDGVNVYSWASLVGSTYTMNREVHLNNLTVADGVTLKPAGYPLFVDGTLTINGSGQVTASGGNGANATAGAGGAGGAGGGSASYTATPLAGGSAGANGANTTGAGSTSTSWSGGNNRGSTSAGTNGGSTAGGNGADGNVNCRGGGGGGSAATSLGGSAGNITVQANSVMCADPVSIQRGVSTSAKLSGGTGGGGGACTGGAGVAGGGGGGGGGGYLLLCSRKVVGVAVTGFNIQSAGGNGGDGIASSGNSGGGGGGGGGGGTVAWIYGTRSGIDNTSVSWAGGTGGIGAQSGTGVAGNGGDGADGFDFIMNTTGDGT